MADVLEDQDPAAATPAPTSPYDDTLAIQDTQRQQKLRTSLTQADGQAPDRAADVQRLATQTGIPAEIVDRNYEGIRQRAKFTATPYTQILKETPALAEWASQPEHAAVASDDMEQLGALEWILKAPQRAIAQQLNSQGYGALRTQSLFRDLTQDEHDQLESYRFHMNEGGELGAGNSWFRGAVTGSLKLLTQLASTVPVYGLAGAAGGAAIGGIGGTIVEPGAGTVAGVIQGARVGFSAGTTYGNAKLAFQLEAGGAYDEYLNLRDEFGHPMDPQAAKVAALATGTINAGLMTVGGAVVGKGLAAGGEKLLAGAFTRDAVTAALRQPTVRAALTHALTEYGKVLTEGTAIVVGMRGVNILAGEIARAQSAGSQLAPGQLEQGNVDLFKQPEVHNPDGTTSTVDSVGVNLDDKEYLLPTVTPDGRHLASPEEAIAEFKKSGKHLGVFDSPESGTRFAQQVHEDFAAGKYKARSTGKELLEAAAHGLQSFAFAGALGPAMGIAHDAQRAIRAEQNANVFKALGQGAAASKTIQRMPEAAQRFVEAATKGGPVETVYAPVESWDQYWQSVGVDPAEVASDVIGSRDAYIQAKAQGGDLAIPTARYAVKLAGTEHNSFFANELRLGPDEMNVREAKAFEDRLAAESQAEATPEASPVRGQVLEQLQGAGIPAETAAHYADLYESAIGSLAERSGMDPAALYAQYGLKVTRPDLEAAGAPGTPARAGQAAVPATAGEVASTAGLLGEVAPDRRQTPGTGPDGVDRRQGDLEGFRPDMSTAERAALLRKENPNVDAEGKAAGERARATKPEQRPRAGQTPAEEVGFHNAADETAGGDAAAETRPGAQAGEGPRDGDRPGQQSEAGRGGLGEGEGARAEPEPRRLSSLADAGGPSDAFERRPLADTTARLTEGVRRELLRILDEMETFPYTARTWNWIEGGPKTGNAAGGAADIVAGSAGAEVYHDILSASPVNKRGNQPARKARGSRGDVLAALRTLRETGHVQNNLQEGALRVAEHRDAGDYAFLTGPALPPSWGEELPLQVQEQLRQALDESTAPGADLLNAASLEGVSEILEPQGPVDTSFNINEFNQSLFDDIEPPDPKTDTLTTGELQPRLPGAEDVRDQNIATPEVAEAPFALQSEVRKPRSKQTELFQSVFHGSPHQFDEFSLQAIGTGEGAQAYGWGLYFAGEREVAEYYRDAIMRQRGDGLPFTSASLDGVAYPAGTTFGNWLYRLKTDGWDTVRIELEKSIKFNKEYAPDQAALQESQLARLKDIDIAAIAVEGKGRVYQVDIPEDHQFLQYDRLISQQSPQVQAALQALGYDLGTPTKIPTAAEGLELFNSDFVHEMWREDVGIRESLKQGLHLAREGNDDLFGRWFEQNINLMLEEGRTEDTGRQAYEAVQQKWNLENRHATLGESAKAASLQLAQVGIAGIQYLDGASRYKFEGSSNYVLFDDRLAKIQEFYQSAPAEVTQENLTAWTQELKDRVGPDLAKFDVYLTGKGDLHLSMFQVDRGARQAGLGTRVMQELTRFADLNGKRITLKTANRSYGWGTTSRARLVEFYKRFGFRENKGPARDFGIDADVMLREPTLPNEMGQPLYHGSPHDFERFSLEHVGTGEGAAAYGHGLYFAENRDVAAGYHDRLAGDPQIQRMKIGTLNWSMERSDYSRRASENTIENVRASLTEDLLIDPMGLLGAGEGGFREHVLKTLDEKIAGYREEDYPEGVVAGEQLRAELEKPGALSIKFDPKTGGVYQVDIPDEHIAKMLDWDAPIKDQPPPVKDLVRDALKEQGYLGKGDNGPRQLTTAFKAYAIERGGMTQGPTGELAYDVIAAGEAARLSKDLIAQRDAIDAKYPTPTRPAGPSGWGEQPHRFQGPDGQADFKEWVRLNGAIEKNKQEGKRLASEKLAASGVPGLRYLDAGSRDATSGKQTRNVVVFDESIVTLTHKDGTPFTPAERKEFLQETGGPGGDQKRGSIRFGPDRQFEIRLLERADLSTFLHESGHFFLEVLGDINDSLAAVDPAQLTPKQKRLLSDYGGTLQALGVDRREAIGTPQHEQFAKLFEAYLMEGRAPSVELQGAFSRFRAWLVSIYRSLSNLNVTLTDPVRGVLDRLVATDRAIQEAEARRGLPEMFLTAEQAGMSAPEFALYRNTIEDASRTAREELDRKLLSEVTREQTRVWKEQRADVQQRVEADVYQRPAYRALSAITRGTNPDGSPLVEGLETPPMRLSRQTLVERFGEERLKRLPRFTYSREGGLDPEMVAGLFGYSSGDELLTALEQAPPMRAVIEQETSRTMIAEHGSLLLDGTLHDAAQGAIANEDREFVLRKELKALGQLRRTVTPFQNLERAKGAEALQAEQAERAYERRWMAAESKLKIAMAEGRKQVEIDALQDEISNLKRKARGGAAQINAAIPTSGQLRDNARARIAALPIRQINADVFWSASRRAGQQALEKAARQDFDGAIIAKQNELINLHLYREAERVQEDVADRVRYAQRLGTNATRARIGLAGGSYLEQIDGILDRFEFAKVSQKQLDKRANIRAWADGLESQGYDVDLPASVLDEARRKNYQELTVEEFLGVTDALKQIDHLASLKNRLLKAADNREYAVVRDSIVDTIRTQNQANPLPLEFRPGDEKVRAVSDWFASHRKMSDIAQQLDGYAEGGPMWDAFIRPLNEAADAQTARFGDAGGKLQDILERAYPKGELGTLHEKTHIPAIGGSLSKEARLAVALNWGNETSQQRLTADPSRRWNRQQVEAILDTLDRRDWQFVQDVWQYIGTFWPEIAAKQERVVGIAPEKVEGVTIHTKFGDIQGDYYPLVYDGRLSPRAAQNEAASQAKLGTQAAYVRSTTKRGHTEARVQNVKLPVRLELGVMFQHVEQVVHDLTHHEMLIDTTRLVRDPAVAKAIIETRGDLVYQQLTRGLQDVAIGSTPPARNVLDKAANYMRTGTQLAMLGYNLWTGVQQPLGVFNGMARVGPQWVTRGLLRWMRDAATMENTTKWIAEVSPMMAERTNTATQDLHDLRVAFRSTGSWFDTLVRKVSSDVLTQQTITDSFLWHIGLMQRVADVPTWLGAYEKAMAGGEPEARAYRLADQAVLDSQGGGQVKDLAQVQRGGPVARLFMTFYSYGNTIFNATSREVGLLAQNKTPAGLGTFLGHLSLLYVAPALATVSMGHLFGKFGSKDQAEDWLLEVGKESLSTALNTMVLVRELGGLVQSTTRGYAGPAGARTIQLFYDLGREVSQGKVDEGLGKALNAVAGVLFRYPAAQVQRTIDGYNALEEGKTTNPGVLVTGPPPKAKQ